MKLIYTDQAFISGAKGEYPEHLESACTTAHGLELLLRPVKFNDEPLLKDFFYSLSDKSLYRRFLMIRRYMPHEELQKHFVVIDYTREMVILAVKSRLGREMVTGVAQYCIDESGTNAEVSIVVRDDYQNKGIGHALLTYIARVARERGLQTFEAMVMPENKAVFRLVEKMGLKYEQKWGSGMFQVIITL